MKRNTEPDMDSGISIETFVNADQKTKDRLTFELLHTIVVKVSEQPAMCRVQMETCQERMDEQSTNIQKLKNDRVKNAAKATGGGVIGGFVAVLAKWIIGGNP